MRTDQRMEISEGTKQFIGGVVGERVRMGLDVVHDTRRAASDEVRAAVIMKDTVVHMVLQSSQRIVCRPAQRGATNLSCLSIYVEE